MRQPVREGTSGEVIFKRGSRMRDEKQAATEKDGEGTAAEGRASRDLRQEHPTMPVCVRESKTSAEHGDEEGTWLCIEHREVGRSQIRWPCQCCRKPSRHFKTGSDIIRFMGFFNLKKKNKYLLCFSILILYHINYINCNIILKCLGEKHFEGLIKVF